MSGETGGFIFLGSGAVKEPLILVVPKGDIHETSF